MARALLPLVAALAFCGALASAHYDVKGTGFLSIPSEENTTLSADGWIPTPKTPNETFPLLVFPNSWSVPQIEYILKAHELAKDGYVCLEYETRGWWLSGGEIDTAGPLDRKDSANVLTWALAKAAEWHINTEKVAFVGISYGAGLSLMAAGNDTRVTTAVSMSGWGKLLNGFYFQKTPNKHEADSLTHSAQKWPNRAAPSLPKFRDQLINHRDINHTLAWAALRSPEDLFLETYNARKVPIFLSNNMLDRIFFPQAKLEFFDRLQGPKYMLLNKGSHAVAEAVGLTTIENKVWTEAKRWLDHFLKGIDTGILSGPRIHIQAGLSIFDNDYKPFSRYPDPNRTVFTSLYFTKRGTAQTGSMSSTAPTDATTDAIQFTPQPPLVEAMGKSDTKWTLGEPPTVQMTNQSTNYSLIFLSEPMAAETLVCGTPTMDLVVGVPGHRWQVYGFLYDVDPSGVGAMMSDFVYTRWEDDDQHAVGPKRKIVNAQWRTTCRSVAAGNRLGVGFVLYNHLYSQANSVQDWTLHFGYGAASSIRIPTYKN